MDKLAELASETSDRFQRKRETILEAAAELINARGLKGLTFVGVAKAVDLNTTSITYYFKRKEQLASEAMARSLSLLEETIEQASKAQTPQARVLAYLDIHFDLAKKIALNEMPAPTILSELRALEEPMRSDLIERYRKIIARTANFFEPLDDRQSYALNYARAHVLLDVVHWKKAWLPKYSLDDFDRVKSWMFDLFANGLAKPSAAWAPEFHQIDAEETGDEISRETFLRAATLLINERGYRGSSVERIAAKLNVSKGSFYHHLDGKDGLVLDCFDRSYDRVSRAQRLAINMDGSYWQKLSSAIATLLAVQFEGAFPLMRITALQALPAELRGDVVQRSDRMAQRFAGLIIDGIAEGTMRPTDPIIASQCIMSLLNSAFDFHRWAELRGSRDEAVSLYASTLAFGLFSNPKT
ncbi:MAG: AcrR family transcriptional regulator [Halocynthiibacter sp.]|jgi:AcrR family transcriptional regulator